MITNTNGVEAIREILFKKMIKNKIIIIKVSLKTRENTRYCFSKYVIAY